MGRVDGSVDWTRVCMAQAELKLASISAKLRQTEHTFFWHSHPFFECGLVLEGNCRWHVGPDSYDLAEGEVIIVPQGAVHREWITSGAHARLSWIGFVSAAMSGQSSEALDAITVLEGLPAVAGAGRGHMQLVADAAAVPGERLGADGLRPLKIPLGRWSAEIRRLFLAIYDEQGEAAFGAEVRINLCLRELLLLLVRSMRPQEPGCAGAAAAAGSAAAVPLRQVQLAHAASRYFDNNTEQGVTIESVARYFRLTPQYFSTLFRRVHGTSPARYQQGARVRLASRLLLGSQRSVKEIASLCGYADSPHFCRQFKAHTGQSPAEYRLYKIAGKER